MNVFKITYTDGSSYQTNANGTLSEFSAYLLQFGNRVTDENPVTGKETHRYIAKIEQIPQWEKIEVIDGYTTWKTATTKDNSQCKAGTVYYNVTTDGQPPKTDSGYFSYGAMLGLKNLKPYPALDRVIELLTK